MVLTGGCVCTVCGAHMGSIVNVPALFSLTIPTRVVSCSQFISAIVEELKWSTRCCYSIQNFPVAAICATSTFYIPVGYCVACTVRVHVQSVRVIWCMWSVRREITPTVTPWVDGVASLYCVLCAICTAGCVQRPRFLHHMCACTCIYSVLQ